MKICDETEKYKYMIQAFGADFDLATKGECNLADLDVKEKELAKDIQLLNELSFLLRYGKARILVTEEDQYDNSRE